jgi:hypothetical protein
MGHVICMLDENWIKNVDTQPKRKGSLFRVMCRWHIRVDMMLFKACNPWRCWLNLSGSAQFLCKYSNKLSGFIKVEFFFFLPGLQVQIFLEMLHHFHMVSYFRCCTNPCLERLIFLCTGLNIIHKISCLFTTTFIHLFHYIGNWLCDFLYTVSMQATLSSNNRWFKHILLS